MVAAGFHLSPWITFVQNCTDEGQNMYPRYENLPLQFFLLSFQEITK